MNRLPGGASQAQIRHRQQPTSVTVTIDAEGAASVLFEEPQRAVTPGQFAVLYADGCCLGGAVIRRAIPHVEHLRALQRPRVKSIGAPYRRRAGPI